MKKKDFFRKIKNDYPNDDEIERTLKFKELFNIKIGRDLPKLYLESDIILLTCVFEKIIKVSVEEIDINPLYYLAMRFEIYWCILTNTPKQRYYSIT